MVVFGESARTGGVFLQFPSLDMSNAFDSFPLRFLEGYILVER